MSELDLFLRMWRQSLRRSEVSNEALTEFSVGYFCHVLGKGAYPRFRLRPSNIIVVTYAEHIMWENERWRCIADPRWDWVFLLRAHLIRRYYVD